MFLELDPIRRELMRQNALPPPPLTSSGQVDRFFERPPPFPSPQISPLPFPSPPPANDEDECRKICYKYNINGGQTYNDINTYGWKTDVEVYREIEELINMEDDGGLRKRINKYTQNKARDVKGKIRSKKPVGKTQQMKDAVYYKIKELQVWYFGEYDVEFGNDNNNNNNGDNGDEFGGDNDNNNHEFGEEFDDMDYDDYDFTQYDDL
ncbi:MAG: hypothetical protein GY755_24170 [Chloroflexi bacterium]|nr:hypothetical protein [Chloroflexota bacterium]